MPYGRPLLKKFTSTFIIIIVSHLSGEILTFQKLIPTLEFSHQNT